VTAEPTGDHPMAPVTTTTGPTGPTAADALLPDGGSAVVNPAHPDGPSVVAIGGGHGLAATLRATRRYAGRITAVVSVADDGGSSGRLRETLGVVALGDLRRCLSALADERSLLGSSLEYRFPAGDLAGHPLGNVLLAGLAATATDLVAAIDEVARAVGTVGRVLPAAGEPVTLTAEGLWRQPKISGQVAVQNTEGVRRIALEPPDPATPPAVVHAIEAADQVVIGPGSLFTSVLAAAVVPGILDALRRTDARRVYVCNLRPQPPETARFTTADHVQALLDHGIPVDVALCHGITGEEPERAVPGSVKVDVVTRSVARAGGATHDTELLGDALSELSRAVVRSGHGSGSPSVGPG